MKKSKFKNNLRSSNNSEKLKKFTKLKRKSKRVKKKYFEYDPEEALDNYNEHQNKSGISSELLLDDKLKSLRMIVFNALQRKNVFGYYERKRLGWILMVMIDFNIPTLKKTKPASWSLWGPVWPMTWLLPRAIASWKYQVGERGLESLRECFKTTLNKAFSNDGEFIISFFNYPHWQTTTTLYPELHGHGCISIIRVPGIVKKKFRGVSPLDLWKKLPDREKAESIRQFLEGPPIVMNADDRCRLNVLYKEGLREIFGRSTLRGEKELVWVGNSPLYAKSEHEGYSWYLKNNPTSILNKMQDVWYEPSQDRVTFKAKKNELFLEMELASNIEYSYPLNEFVTRFILKPQRPFFGVRFMGIGGFGANNHLKKVYSFLSQYPEKLDPYYKDIASIDTVSQKTLTQDYIEEGEGDDSWWQELK